MLTTLVKQEKTRAGALLILNQLIQQHETPEMMTADVSMLLDVRPPSQAEPPLLISPQVLKDAKSDFDLKKDVLLVVNRIFGGQKRAKDSFRECGGFVCLVSLIMGLDSTAEVPARRPLPHRPHLLRSRYSEHANSLLWVLERRKRPFSTKSFER